MFSVEPSRTTTLPSDRSLLRSAVPALQLTLINSIVLKSPFIYLRRDSHDLTCEQALPVYFRGKVFQGTRELGQKDIENKGNKRNKSCVSDILGNREHQN